MKVLMLGRYHLMEHGGGDKVQIENTAKELRNLGVTVDIHTDEDFDPAEYDLIHIFQLDWTPETYLYAKKAFAAKKPIVLSPIHHSVKEVKRFDDEYVFDFRRLSKFLFRDQFSRDTFKNLYRSFRDFRKLKITLFSIFYGFKKMQREVINMSNIVLVQTELEAVELAQTFDVKFDYLKVVNGVGRNFINLGEVANPLNIKDYIICVGRIEPRKNQLNVIKAVQKLRKDTNDDYKLVLVGLSKGLKHFEYSALIENAVSKNPWIHQVEKVPYEAMPAYYKYAKVCVSASWFETTGLTSLEALYCGTNAVASGDRAKEYLGNYATYCDPGNVDSIATAIKKEYEAPRPVISDEIKREYTWENAAKKTLEAYNKVLVHD